MLAANRSGVERWADVQRRHDEAQALLARHAQSNEDLQARLAEYKELNAQQEASWQQRCEQLVRERDATVDTLRAASERAMHLLKADCDQRLSDLQAQCKADLTQLDGLRREALAKADSHKSRHTKLSAQLADLKDVLQLAVTADQRKDALVEEVRASARTAKEQLDKDREELTKGQE